MRRKAGALILAVFALMLSGCFREKYRLIFEDSGFHSAKRKYAPGEQVEVTYDMIGTDMDYTFYSDDVDFERDFDAEGYVFRFAMPAHDVTIGVSWRNTMTVDPGIGQPPDPDDGGGGTEMPDDYSGEKWYCPECGTENYGNYCAECGLSRPNPDGN